jgi:deoxyribonuclease V
MKIPRVPHSWALTPSEAVAEQRRLCHRVRLRPAPVPRRVVGLDCAFLPGRIIAVAVVWDVAGGRVLETRGASDELRFPYVPGLLSFREIPVLLKVLRRVRTRAEGVLCDGQGIAHPRRLGLASHLGILLGVPTVGCAKSRLCGTHDAPAAQRGAVAPLLDGDERIGSVLRTRDGVKPVYVSPGHLADHDSAVAWVLACGAGFRLPEPTRLADRLVARFKKAGRYRGGMIACDQRAGWSSRWK